MTRNLFSCMKRLAIHFLGWWWIDVICINQDDDEEKIHQVQKMTEIYGQAEKVLAWLGKQTTTSSLAMRLLKDLHDTIRDRKNWNRGKLKQISFADEELSHLGLPSINDPTWDYLNDLLHHPYFSRVWVLQELVLAKKAPLVMYGDTFFYWTYFEAVKDFLEELGWDRILLRDSPYRSESGVGPILAIFPEIRTPRSMGIKVSIGRLLSMCRFLEASDPRDKIIGLLGLISPADSAKSQIAANYHLSTIDFYTDVTGKLISQNRSFEILSHVEDLSLPRTVGLPSWVPNFACKSHCSERFSNFRASIDSEFWCYWSPGSPCVQVRAHFVDEIQTVPKYAAEPGNDMSHSIIEWYNLAATSANVVSTDWMSALAHPQTLDKGFVNTFWQTLLRDTIHDREHPVPDQYGNHFAAFMISISTNFPSYSNTRHLYRAQSLVPKETLKLFLCNQRELLPGSRGNSALCDQALDLAYCRFFLTRSSRMGVGPMSLRPGDQIALFSGAGQVFILRRIIKDSFQLIGATYVHCIMHGEGLEERDTPFETITLI